jgi:hypothetical protein
MSADPRAPAWVERTGAWVDGAAAGRLIVVFRARGCGWALGAAGGCRFCGFLAMTTRGAPVAEEDLAAQLDAVLDRPGALAGVAEVDLFNSGSFFADDEMPPAVRAYALDRLGRTAVRRVLVESRPEHVTEARVRDAVARVGTGRLEVGIGLESADDHVRETLVRKGFGRADFERAVAAVGAAGAGLLTYVLLKPPGLTEAAAVDDAIASSRYVFDVARSKGVRARVALQPAFVAPGTELEAELRAGRYTPPSLWSVIEVVRAVRPLGEIAVGASDEGLRPACVPSGCPECTPKLRAALAAYERSHDLAALAVECGCRPPRP